MEALPARATGPERQVLWATHGVCCLQRGRAGSGVGRGPRPGTGSGSPNSPVSVTPDGHLTTTSHAGHAGQAWPLEGFALRSGTEVGGGNGRVASRRRGPTETLSHATTRRPSHRLMLRHGRGPSGPDSTGAPRAAFCKETRAPRPSRHERWPCCPEPLELPTSVALGRATKSSVIAEDRWQNVSLGSPFLIPRYRGNADTKGSLPSRVSGGGPFAVGSSCSSTLGSLALTAWDERGVPDGTRSGLSPREIRPSRRN